MFQVNLSQAVWNLPKYQQKRKENPSYVKFGLNFLAFSFNSEGLQIDSETENHQTPKVDVKFWLNEGEMNQSGAF